MFPLLWEMSYDILITPFSRTQGKNPLNYYDCLHLKFIFLVHKSLLTEIFGLLGSHDVNL